MSTALEKFGQKLRDVRAGQSTLPRPAHTSKPRAAYKSDLLSMDYASRNQRDRQSLALASRREMRLLAMDQFHMIVNLSHIKTNTRSDAAARAYKASDDHALPSLAYDCHDEVDESCPNQSKARNNTKKGNQSTTIRSFYASQLVTFDWMLTPPENWEEWCVALRPLGPRCLLVIENNFVTVRHKNGSFFRHFRLPLEMESRFPIALCTVDSIYDEGRDMFWATDCMVWNRMHVSDTDFNCRRHYLNSAVGIDSMKELLHQSNVSNWICALPFFKVSHPVVHSLYHNPASLPFYSDGILYPTDSLLFVHEGALYTTPDSCSLFLQFRDENLSLYGIDRPAKEVDSTPQFQSAALKLLPSGKLITGDGVVVIDLKDRPVHFPNCVKNNSNSSSVTVLPFSTKLIRKHLCTTLPRIVHCEFGRSNFIELCNQYRNRQHLHAKGSVEEEAENTSAECEELRIAVGTIANGVEANVTNLEEESGEDFDLTLLRRCSVQKDSADVFSRIVFQCLTRLKNSSINLENLILNNQMSPLPMTDVIKLV